MVLKREGGTTGVTDLLVIVLIADAAQNGMAGQCNSSARRSEPSTAVRVP